MSRLNYALLNRQLQRCDEIATEPAMSSTVVNVYNEALKQKAEAYRSAFDAIAVAESKAKTEGSEAKAMIEAFEGTYKSARSAVLAILPTTVLPATLSAQPTDTDTLYAIETLLKVVKGYEGKTWADDLLKGELGEGSVKVIDELSQSIASNKDLAKAISDRASAFGPAVEGLTRFRRVVRDTLGSSSKQYQRIRLRVNAQGDEEQVEAAVQVNPANDVVKDVCEPKPAEASAPA